MSIVPASMLSSADLSMLGNNLTPPRRQRADKRPMGLISAVNRSLASVGEKVQRLHARRRQPIQ